MILLATEDDTARLARAIAQHLQPVDCLTLTGTLGAGKTTLMRYLIQHLQREQSAVISPSFMLVQEYEVSVQSSEFRVQETTLYHVDGYRLNSPTEIPELGLEECFETGIVAIEWPEIFAGFLPKNRLELTLEMTDNTNTMGDGESIPHKNNQRRIVHLQGRGAHETIVTQISQEFYGNA